ncbi:KpsF/GutQ family sugar-phosphate isomerase [Vibrio harveyi]|nr:KpsF/GutQ family sugar-phosphate isomerase [Vibrio harveyi]
MSRDAFVEEIFLQGRHIVSLEIEQAKRLIPTLRNSFVDVCQTILKCKGKVIVMGLGKSGHIGKKIAATLASTGTSSFFIHPTEALHGDLGMVDRSDLIMLISNSGETTEFKIILPLLQAQGIISVGVTANQESYLAKNSNYPLDIASEKEACPFGLAPTASATNTLILGDAIALTVMKLRNFDHTDFARTHPAGSLGSRLLTTIEQLLDEQHKSAFCYPTSTIQQAVEVMCKTGYGLLAVVEKGKVAGAFTDGDLRRAFTKGVLSNTTLSNVMTKNPTCITQSSLCTEALELMGKLAITALPVLDRKGAFVGVINQHSIQKAGIFQ